MRTFDSPAELDEDKNVYEQIKMCFDAYSSENWNVIFDWYVAGKITVLNGYL